MEKEAASVRKNWKIIVSFILVFIVLGTAYFLLQRTEPPKSPAEVTPAPIIQVLSEDATQVMQIEITNGEETYAFTRSAATEPWVVKNEPYVEIYSNRVESLCVSTAMLSAEGLIARSAPDVSIYGLTSPQAAVTLTFENGETATVQIGDMAPGNGGYYARLAESEDVYLIPTATGAQFLSPLSSFRVLMISALNMNDIRYVSITRGGQALVLEYEGTGEDKTVSSSWNITSPIQRKADDSLVQEKLLQPLSNIIAAGVADDNPADVSKYGFAGDTVEIRTLTADVRFSVGEAGGAEYIMLEGKPAVYYMGNDVLSFMDVGAFDVLERMTNLISIDTVSSVDVILPGITANLLIETEGDKSRFFVNGTEADEKAFKNMYVELIALEVDGEVQSPSDVGTQKAEASIVFTFVDGSTTTLAYYPYDEFNYAVYENSECTFYMKKTKITELSAKLQAFAANPAV